MVPFLTNLRRQRVRWIVPVLAGVLLTAVTVQAQRRYDLFILAIDGEGFPITDLKASELQYKENGLDGTVVSLTPFQWPLRVSVLVDNGPDSGERLVHLRSGLKKFFERLPRDVEVELIATAPNPRWLTNPRRTRDPVQIMKAVDLLTPDDHYGRFTDSLVEYAQRLDVEFRPLRSEERTPYVPVLVSIGSTGVDGSRIDVDPTNKALQSLRRYGVATHFLMFSPNRSGGVPDINEGATVLVAKEAQRFTGGEYEALAASASSNLNTRLPELADRLAVRHIKQTVQYRITLERPSEATSAQPENLTFALSRPGAKYVLSLYGNYP